MVLETQNIIFPLSLGLYGLGFILNAGILIVACKDLTLRKNIHDKCLISLTGCSFTWCLVLMVCLSFAYANDGYMGPLGTVLCSIEGISISFLVGITMTCHFVLAFDRWSLVKFDLQVASKWLLPVIAIAFSMDLVTLAGIISKPATWIQRYESKTYCFIRTWDYETFLDIWPSVFGMVKSVAISNLTFFMYYGVYTKTVRTIKARKSFPLNIILVKVSDSNKTNSGASKDSGKDSGGDSSLEEKVFYRCCLIVGSFSILYIPATVSLIIRIVTNGPLTSWTDAIISNIATLDVVVTPLIILYTRKDYQNSLASILLIWKKADSV